MQLHWIEATEVPHPLLEIEIGKATQACSGAELDDYATAIISQVEVAMASIFSDEAGCPEQMVVVAHCKGASSMQASLYSKLLKPACT